MLYLNYAQIWYYLITLLLIVNSTQYLCHNIITLKPLFTSTIYYSLYFIPITETKYFSDSVFDLTHYLHRVQNRTWLDQNLNKILSIVTCLCVRWLLVKWFTRKLINEIRKTENKFITNKVLLNYFTQRTFHRYIYITCNRSIR